MAHLQLAACQQLSGFGPQIQQTQQIRYCRPRTPHCRSSRFVCQFELIYKPRQRHRLLQRVQILTLNVLYQC